jgi:hypothetical protein
MTRRGALSVLAGALAVVLQQPALAQTAKNVQQKAAEAWEAIKVYAYEKKDDAVTYGKQLMRKIDARITHLEGKASKASGDAKMAYKQEIKTLKAKRAEVGKQLDVMGEASAASWDAAKQGFADAYQDLYHSYEKTAAKFK